MSVSVNCRVGDEIEVTYKLEYKMAEVARLPDAAEYSHVATSLGVPDPSEDTRRLFSVVREFVKVTEDDQTIRFVTQSKGLPESNTELHAQPVVAWFGNGTRMARGEVPVEVAMLMVKPPNK